MKLRNRNIEVFELFYDSCDIAGVECYTAIFYLVLDKARLVHGVLIAFESSLSESSVVCRSKQIFFDNVRRTVKEFHF